MLDLIRLNGVNPKKVGNAVMACLNGLQGFTPEEQAASAACLFHIIRRVHDVHAGKVLEVGMNLLDRASKETPELRAASQYAEKELT